MAHRALRAVKSLLRAAAGLPRLSLVKPEATSSKRPCYVLLGIVLWCKTLLWLCLGLGTSSSPACAQAPPTCVSPEGLSQQGRLRAPRSPALAGCCPGKLRLFAGFGGLCPSL